MERKTKGGILLAIGLVLIIFGALPLLGFNYFDIIDTTAPNIKYTYPYANATIARTIDKLFIAYVQDGGNISSVNYYDKYYPNGLSMTPWAFSYKNLDNSAWLPDLNDDGKVDMIDNTIFGNAMGAVPTDANWNPDCDFNKDNIIDIFDMQVLASWMGTRIYLANHSFSSITETISGKFIAIDGSGNPKEYIVTFTISGSVSELKGKWYVNNNEVIDTTVLFNISTLTVKFVAQNAPSSWMTAKIMIPTKDTYVMTKTSDTTWEKTITITESTALVFEANDNGAINNISVTLNIPNQPTDSRIYISYTMLIAGVVCALGSSTFFIKERPKHR